MPKAVITIDKDIPIPFNLYSILGQVDDLRSMAVGDSFFLEGVSPYQLSGVVPYLHTMFGVTLFIAEATPDEVYMENGTRLWRIAAPAARKTLPAEDGTLYWHHPESDCVFTTDASDSLKDIDPLCVQITQSEFDQLDAMYAKVAKPDAEGNFHWTKPGIGGVFRGRKLPEGDYTLISPEQAAAMKRQPDNAPGTNDNTDAMVDETGRKFYVIEYASGVHLAWGSSLPIEKQGLSPERRKGVRNISLKQFNDIENRNYTMHYWIDPEEGRYFFICSCLNTNASFNLTGVKEVSYEEYLRFEKYMKAGFTWGSDTQYVRRLKNGDCFRVRVDGMATETLDKYITDYEAITPEVFAEWESENEL